MPKLRSVLGRFLKHTMMLSSSYSVQSAANNFCDILAFHALAFDNDVKKLQNSLSPDSRNGTFVSYPYDSNFFTVLLE